MQLLGTAVPVGVGLYLVGGSWQVSVYLGLLVGLSSTAIVLRLLVDSGELEAAHGRISLAVLLLQDLAVVPIMLLVPLLAGEATSIGAVATTFGKMFGVILGIWVVASFAFPRILEGVLRSRSRELFTLVAVVAAVGTAYVTNLAGVSLALGAFLAGIVISESPYSHHVFAEVAPFRDVFNSIFFVSIGLLVDPMIYLQQPALTGGLVVGVMGLKGLVAGLVAVAFGYGKRVAILVGAALSQVGEFAFVGASVGLAAGLLGLPQYQMLLAVSVATMFVTPLLVRLAGRLMERRPAPEEGAGGRPEPQVEKRHEEGLDGHVIIVGYGVNGRNLARVLEELGVPLLIIELNPNRAREAKSAGYPTHHGDATRRLTLEHAGIGRARDLVVSTADPTTARGTIAVARSMYRDLTIIVRTRFVREVDQLRRLGADEVIPEEFESSLQLVGLVMRSYGASPAAIHRQKALLRREEYSFLRGEGEAPGKLSGEGLGEILEGLEVEVVVVDEESKASGRSARELDLRVEYGVSLIGYEREDEVVSSPDPDEVLKPGDRAILAGPNQKIAEALPLFRQSEG